MAAPPPQEGWADRATRILRSDQLEEALECIEADDDEDLEGLLFDSEARWAQPNLLRLVWAAVRHCSVVCLEIVVDLLQNQGMGTDWTTLPAQMAARSPSSSLRWRGSAGARKGRRLMRCTPYWTTC